MPGCVGSLHPRPKPLVTSWETGPEDLTSWPQATFCSRFCWRVREKKEELIATPMTWWTDSRGRHDAKGRARSKVGQESRVSLSQTLSLISSLCHRRQHFLSVLGFFLFPVLLRNNWHKGLSKFKTHSLMVWFTHIVKWLQCSWIVDWPTSELIYSGGGKGDALYFLKKGVVSKICLGATPQYLCCWS